MCPLHARLKPAACISQGRPSVMVSVGRSAGLGWMSLLAAALNTITICDRSKLVDRAAGVRTRSGELEPSMRLNDKLEDREKKEKKQVSATTPPPLR